MYKPMNSFGLQSCLGSLIGAPGITGWFRPCRTHYRAKTLVWDKTPAWNVFFYKDLLRMFLGLTTSCQALKKVSGVSTLPGHEQKVSACSKK